jgi:thiol-disulfide isomerase/thioredoxin
MNTWIIVLIVLVLFSMYSICNSTTSSSPTYIQKIVSPASAPGALPRAVVSRSTLVSRMKSKFGNITSKFGNITSKFGKMNSNSKFNASVSYSPDNTKMENITDDTVLIFYAPWCGHCKKSMNDFKQASSMGNGKIMLINSDEEPEAVKQYNVRGFPTIMKANGETHTGGRDVSSIMDFAQN